MWLYPSKAYFVWIFIILHVLLLLLKDLYHVITFPSINIIHVLSECWSCRLFVHHLRFWVGGPRRPYCDSRDGAARCRRVHRGRSQETRAAEAQSQTKGTHPSPLALLNIPLTKRHIEGHPFLAILWLRMWYVCVFDVFCKFVNIFTA